MWVVMDCYFEGWGRVIVSNMVFFVDGGVCVVVDLFG